MILGKWNTGPPRTSGSSGTPTSQSNGSAAKCLSADVDTGHYVTLIRCIQQEASRIKESPARLDPARKAAEKAGGKVHSWFLTMGKYDAVIVSECPTDDAAAKSCWPRSLPATLTTQTMKAFTEDEYRKIVAAR